jgi:CHAT domain-containing protein/tetratricopeptide (TPR) repeat protein
MRRIIEKSTFVLQAIVLFAAFPIESAEVPGWEDRLKQGRDWLEKGYPWEAEKLFTRCLEEAEKNFKSDDPRLQKALASFGDVQIYLGRAEKAMPAYTRQLQLAEDNYGKDSGRTLEPLLGLTETYTRLYKFREAEPLATRAVNVAEKAFPMDSNEVRAALKKMEVFYARAGRNAEAEQVCRRIINNTASDPTRFSLGYERSQLISYCLKQKKIVEADGEIASFVADCEKLVLKTDPIEFGNWLERVGTIAQEDGFADKAVPILKRSIEIFDQHPGEPHANLGFALYALGKAYVKQAKSDEAETILRRALKYFENVNAPPRLIELHDCIGSVASDRQDYRVAEAEYRAANEIAVRFYGDQSRNHADCQFNLGRVLLLAHRPADAAQYFRRYGEVVTALYGTGCESRICANAWLAFAQVGQNREAEAMALLKSAVADKCKLRNVTFHGMSEEKRMEWADDSRWIWEALFSLGLRGQDRNADFSACAFEAALTYSGAVLDATIAEQQAARTSGNTELAELAGAVTDARRKLAGLYLNESASTKMVETQKAREDAEAEVRALEAKLAMKSEPFADLRRSLEADSGAILKLIEKDVALLMVVKANLYDFSMTESPTAHYLAFVSTQTAQSHLIDLGLASEMDEAIARTGETIVATISQDAKKQPADHAPVDLKSQLRKLSDKLFKPVWNELKTSQRWILCFDGALATLAVYPLPQPESDKLVIDNFEVSYVSNPREIIQLERKSTQRSGAIIVADPDFDAKNGDAVVGPNINASWRRLPGTHQEAAQLQQLFDKHGVSITLLSDAKASKQALLHLDAPRFLHIATHGYYLPESLPADPGSFASRGLAGLAPSAVGAGNGGEVTKQWFAGIGCPSCGRIHDPLLRSGLILSGANTQGLKASVVTSRELMGMNLWGTELVVLSACESGLGVVSTGEGVMGLRRSFLTSGARTVLTSLWKIPDRETASLMTGFYARKLDGKRAGSALREAMLELRDTSIKATGSAHPWSWGAFIIVGNPN